MNNLSWSTFLPISGKYSLRPLEHRDRRFESCSGHGCVSAFLCVCVVLCVGRGLGAGLIPHSRSPIKRLKGSISKKENPTPEKGVRNNEKEDLPFYAIWWLIMRRAFCMTLFLSNLKCLSRHCMSVLHFVLLDLFQGWFSNHLSWICFYRYMFISVVSTNVRTLKLVL
jgi:hypothetical protein